MKRKILLYGVILALIIVGIPYIIGLMAEQTFLDSAKTLSEFDGFTVEVVDYQRGIYQSTAQTRITLSSGVVHRFLSVLSKEASSDPNSNQQAKQPVSILFDHQIEHGPYIQKEKGNYKDWLFLQARLSSGLHLSEDAKKLLEEEMGEANFLRAETTITMESAIQISLQGWPIVVEEDGLSQPIWQGVNADWDIADEPQNITGNVVMPGFYFDTEQGIFEAESIRMATARTKSNKQTLWRIDDHTSIAQVRITPSNGATVRFLQGDLRLKSQKEGKANLKMGVAEVSVNDKKYGALQLAAQLNQSNTNRWTATGELKIKQNLLPHLMMLWYQLQGQAIEAIKVDQQIASWQQQKILTQVEDQYVLALNWSAQDLGLP